MRHTRWAILIFLVYFSAQRSRPASRYRKTAQRFQKLGQRVFQQRCAICHAPARPGFQITGPALYKDLVNGSEDAIKEIIRSGSTKCRDSSSDCNPRKLTQSWNI